MAETTRKVKLKGSTTARVDPESVRIALGAVEAPTEFAGRLRGPWVTDATRKELASELAERDAVVASAARREERARIVKRLRGREKVQAEVSRSLRQEAIELQAIGQPWGAVFDAECIADAKRTALKEAADAIESEAT